MRTKYLKAKYYNKVKDCPSFWVNGSIKGMKDKYYGKNALLVKCCGYIFNVTGAPEIYHNLAY